jgi:hypothetical protein|tara:strand:- start:609 stop:767 length:159 start_codon:yes stop_codon:yes gene_type:complete
MVDQESVVQPVETQENASEEPNYTPTEQDIYNPMDAGAQRLKDKDINIERQK